MDQNEQRSKRNGGVRPENSGKSTQTVKHVKLDLSALSSRKRATPIRAVSVRARKRSFDSSKKTAEPRGRSSRSAALTPSVRT